MTEKNRNIAEDEFIEIYGARENNLKNIDLRIPRDEFVVITGLSGSGKGVEHTEQPVEEESRQHDPYYADCGRVLCPELIQSHDCDYVGYAKFDAGYTGVIWYNCFDIRKDQRERCHEADSRYE